MTHNDSTQWRNQWGPGGRLPLPKSYNGKGKAKNRGGKEESGNGNAEERILKVQKSGRAKRELGDNREIDAQCVLEKVLSFLERVNTVFDRTGHPIDGRFSGSFGNVALPRTVRSCYATDST